MKKLLFIAIFPFIISLFLGVSISAQTEASSETPLEETLEAEIVEILEEKQITPEFSEGEQFYQKMKLLVTKGSFKDKVIVVESGVLLMVNQQEYKIGDKVMVSYSKNFEGADVFFITDYIRRGSLLWLFTIFVILTVIIGKWRGMNSLLGMGASFFVIFKFIL